MSDEYEYGPWMGWNGGERPLAASAMVQTCVRRWGEQATTSAGSVRWDHSQVAPGADIIAYRVATPKPKRELVVGKWYRRKGNWWSQVIAVSGDHVWMTRSGNPADGAIRWGAINLHPLIEWSTPPRDEAPE